jgi:hypothetical protein
LASSKGPSSELTPEATVNPRTTSCQFFSVLPRSARDSFYKMGTLTNDPLTMLVKTLGHEEQKPNSNQPKWEKRKTIGPVIEQSRS